MMSHALDPILPLLQRFVCDLEEGLQADSHRVGSAKDQHKGFKKNWVESDLVRALISALAHSLATDDLAVESLGNGGLELVNDHDGTERRFRVKRAKRNGLGKLIVTASSDSILTMVIPPPSLFDEEGAAPHTAEQWVLAYLLNPRTLTFHDVYAGRVIGKKRKKSPYILELADVVRIPHTVPLPPEFNPERDDLDFPDEGEEHGEQAG